MRVPLTFLFAVILLTLAPIGAWAQNDSLLVTLDTDNIVLAPGDGIWLRASIENRTAEALQIGGFQYNPGPFVTEIEFGFALFPTVAANSVFHGDLLQIFARSEVDKTPTAPGVYGSYGFAVFTPGQVITSNNALFHITVTGAATAPEPGTFALTLTGALLPLTAFLRRRPRRV